MMNFAMGVIFGGLLVFGSIAIYTIAQMAGMYDRTVESWWDDEAD